MDTKRGLVLVLMILLYNSASGQNTVWVDSLMAEPENEIIVFEEHCVGCIVLNTPCNEYARNGNVWDQYILWKNRDGYHIKRTNRCGSSGILTMKKWKANPFEVMEARSIELDTTELMYPMSFNYEDSIWFEMSVNHYKYYTVSFLTSSIKEINFRDYVFRKEKEEDAIMMAIDHEFRENYSRYTYNNSTAIKELFDRIMLLLDEKSNRFEISVN